MRDKLVGGAVVATFCFFPFYSTIGLLYADPHNSSLPPLIWLVPAPLVWIFLLTCLASYGIIVSEAVRLRPPFPPLFIATAVGSIGGFVVPGLFGFEPVSGLVLGFAFFVWMLTAAVLVEVQRRLRWVTRASLLALLLSGAFACAFAVLLVLLRRPAELYAFHHGRAVGTFLNTNEVAGYAVIFCATAFGVAMTAPDRALRRTAAAALLCGVVALLLTFSRSGFLGAFAATLGLIAVFRPAPLRAAAIVGGFVALAAGALIFDVHHNPAEALSRLVAWNAGWRTFEHFPLTGVGAIAYYRTYPLIRPPDGPPVGTPISFDPHDVFLTLLSELGVVGVGALIWVWWRWLTLYRAALGQAQGRARLLSLSIAAGLAGLWVFSLFNTLSMLFALWANFMGLALVTAKDEPAARD